MQRPEDRAYARFQRHRDPADLARVYDLLAPQLLRVARHLAPGAFEAEDLLQGTFLAAIEGVERYDRRHTVRSWLLGILANRARLARWYGARVPDPERLRAPEAPDPARAAEEREFQDWLAGALEQLPETFRSPVTLRLREELAGPEIAGRLQRPRGTVRSQLARGLGLLRRALPTGFAGGAALLLGGRSHGLAAVRRQVLAAAGGPAAGTGVAVGLTTGVLLVKPVALSALAAIVALGIWTLARDRDAPRPGPRERPVHPAARDAALGAHPGGSALVQAAAVAAESGERAALPTPRSATGPAPVEAPARGTGHGSAPFGALEVSVVRGTEAEPAPGVVVLLDPTPHLRDHPEPWVGTTDAEGVARFDEVPAGMSLARTLRGTRDSVFVPAGGTGRIELRLVEGITVEGRVVDELGRGVPRAEVWLSDRWEFNRGAVALRADDEGRFRLDSLFSGQFLAARAPGRVPSVLYRVTGSVGSTLRWTLELGERAGRVRGRVLGPEGEPVARAQVLVGEDRYLPRHPMADGTLVPGPPPVHLYADDEGRFATDFVTPGVCRVQARSSGLAPTAIEARVRPGATTEVELWLGQGVTLAGTVTDHLGAPLAGAEVLVGEVQAFARSSTTTGASGTYRLEHLPAGVLEVRAGHRLHGSLATRLEARPGQRLRWDPRLDAGAPGRQGIHGVLLDVAGDPLERHTVVAHVLDGEGISDRRVSRPTDRDGRFLVEVADDRERTLWVQGPGGYERFPLRIVHGVVRGPAPLELRVGGPEGPRGVLTGSVRDDLGEPVEDARIEVWHAQERLWRTFPVAPGTASFRIEHVPPGLLRLTVKSVGHAWAAPLDVSLAEGEERDLGELELATGGRLLVRFDGLPPGFALEDVHVAALSEGFEPVGVFTRRGDHFRSGTLRPGRVRLFAQAPFVRRVDRMVTVEPGTERELLLSLEPAGTRRVVLDMTEGTTELRGLWMSLYDATGGLAWQYTGGGSPAGVDLFAVPGSYRLVGGLSDGRRFETELTIAGYDGSQPPVSVLPRPPGS